MKKLKVVGEILKVYSSGINTHITSPGDIGRIKSLRPSQLPFCPIGFFVRVAKFGSLRALDMKGSFYTSVGTAVHETVQTYLGYSGKFLADWKCRHCGKLSKVSVQHECCGFQMEYREISINYKGVVGHIDAVFLDSDGNYWILDYKTSSVKGSPTKVKNPPLAYKEQVETYALYLYLQYKIKVKGVMLMFIDRDNPAVPKVWAKELLNKDFRRIKERTQTYLKLHKEVLAVKTMKEALALAAYGKCKNRYCSSCRLFRSLESQLKDAYDHAKRINRLPLESLSK